MLVAHRYGPGTRNYQWNSLLYHLLQHFVDALQIGAAKSRQRFLKYFVQVFALRNRFSSHGLSHK